MKITYLQDFAIVKENDKFIVIDTLLDVSKTFTSLEDALLYVEGERAIILE